MGVDSVGRGRQVEAVKYKKGQANYATKFLTRNIESKTGSPGPPPLTVIVFNRICISLFVPFRHTPLDHHVSSPAVV